MQKEAGKQNRTMGKRAGLFKSICFRLMGDAFPIRISPQIVSANSQKTRLVPAAARSLSFNNTVLKPLGSARGCPSSFSPKGTPKLELHCARPSFWGAAKRLNSFATGKDSIRSAAATSPRIAELNSL